MSRLISALLVVLALLLAPLGMVGGGMALAQPQHNSSSVEHCPMAGTAEEGEEGPKLKLDCASTCSAIPARQPLIGECVMAGRVVTAAYPPAPLSGLDPESEIPPPRFS